MAKFSLKTRLMLGVSKVCAYGLNVVAIVAVLAGIGVLVWSTMFGMESSGLMTGTPDTGASGKSMSGGHL